MWLKLLQVIKMRRHLTREQRIQNERENGLKEGEREGERRRKREMPLRNIEGSRFGNRNEGVSRHGLNVALCLTLRRYSPHLVNICVCVCVCVCVCACVRVFEFTVCVGGAMCPINNFYELGFLRSFNHRD